PLDSDRTEHERDDGRQQEHCRDLRSQAPVVDAPSGGNPLSWLRGPAARPIYPFCPTGRLLHSCDETVLICNLHSASNRQNFLPAKETNVFSRPSSWY